jgi:hypothetical protein
MLWRFQKTAIAMLAWLTAAAGCQPALTPKGKPLFATSPMSPDSCVLEVFIIRFPFGDTLANQTLWKDVDELHIPPEVRGRIARNGFRAGLLSGQIPDALARLMELTAKPPVAQEDEPINLADTSAKPRVLRSRIHARPGRRNEIVTSGVYDQLPVLMCEGNGVGGKTYEQAQGVLAYWAFPQTDGRVRIELTPELQYGQPKNSWVPDQGAWRSDFGRPKRAFDDLALTATLTPGSILVLTSLPDRSGSLGHYFFTEKDDRLEQKLLLIRLAHVHNDDLFVPTDALPLE